MTTVDVDVIVAGGGPVGLAVALGARQRGMSVAVVEPRTGVIDRACGEGLMPAALARLAALDVDPPGADLRGIRYVTADGRHEADARFRAGPGRGVRRTELHEALARAAAERGVHRVAARVEHVEQGADTVRAAGVSGRWLVGADGRRSAVARSVGLTVSRAPRHRRYGLRRHLAVAPWTDRVEVHWARDAEAYVTPVGPGCVGVAVLTAARGRTFDEHLSAFPELAGRLADAPAASAVLGAGPLAYRVRGRTAGRVLLVGDAAGFVDALTGEGLAVGLASADAALTCLADGKPEAYEQAWRQLARRSRLITMTLVALTRYAPARHALVPAAAWLPGAFTAAVNALAGG